MRWFTFPKRIPMPRMAVSMALAVLVAGILVLINEASYSRSTLALQQVADASRTRETLNQLLQHMLDAETGQRGYLLTGNASYLEPYDAAIGSIGQTMDTLRERYAGNPEQSRQVVSLGRVIQRNLALLDLTIRLRKDGRENAWQDVLKTNTGKVQMEAIRDHITGLTGKTEQEIANDQAKVLRALRVDRLGVGALAIAGLLAFYVFLRQTHELRLADQRLKEGLQRERDQLEHEVRQRTASLAQLATDLQDVREQERGHLARELHDELGALLTAAKLDVARMRSKLNPVPPEVAVRLQHLTDTLNSVIALKRRIIEDLRPSSLTNLGLVPSLEILAREFGERSGVEVSTALDDVALDESRQLTVYRLVQESLTNVGKYAGAKRANIVVQSLGGHVEVAIDDDGKGFDPALQRPTTHGLAGMRHRVEAAGGRLTIRSSPGRGTRIVATLPTQRA